MPANSVFTISCSSGSTRKLEDDNVVLKISGFGEWKTNWSTDFISDYIKVAIDSFGTKRCMFASNFPVDKFFSKSPYQSFWLAYMKIISKFSHTEINDLLMKNAEKYYRNYRRKSWLS